MQSSVHHNPDGQAGTGRCVEEFLRRGQQEGGLLCEGGLGLHPRSSTTFPVLVQIPGRLLPTYHFTPSTPAGGPEFFRDDYFHRSLHCATRNGHFSTPRSDCLTRSGGLRTHNWLYSSQLRDSNDLDSALMPPAISRIRGMEKYFQTPTQNTSPGRIKCLGTRTLKRNCCCGSTSVQTGTMS
jgi:hypothetical protein